MCSRAKLCKTKVLTFLYRKIYYIKNVKKGDLCHTLVLGKLKNTMLQSCPCGFLEVSAILVPEQPLCRTILSAQHQVARFMDCMLQMGSQESTKTDQ